MNQYLDPAKKTINQTTLSNWSRTKYDQTSALLDTLQSTQSLIYRLDPTFAQRCQQCRPIGSGWIAKQGVSYNAQQPLIDTESQLFNLNKTQIINQTQKYLNQCQSCQKIPSHQQNNVTLNSSDINQIDNCNCPNDQILSHLPSCNFNYEYTRISNPYTTLKETGVNRFDPICMNPQDQSRWQHPGEIGINYRLVAKDNHIPCIPKPIDPTPALPSPTTTNIKCQLTTPVCSAFIQPLHNFYRN